MKKKIEAFQFITCERPGMGHALSADLAYRAGCGWVQLRMKDHTDDAILEEALKAKTFADKYSGILIVNDRPEIAKAAGAHGVHLGKEDMLPSVARAIMGNDAIIGGTANSFQEILHLLREGVDYIGLGPFRFTTTKKRLSQILGIEGYQTIVSRMKNSGINIPIVAIGGIVPDDVPGLREAGVWGVAASGAVAGSGCFETEIRRFLIATGQGFIETSTSKF